MQSLVNAVQEVLNEGQDYSLMFKATILAEKQAWAKAEIDWAKKNLKKDDRIIWYLNWIRLRMAYTNYETINANVPKIKTRMEEAFPKQKNYIDKIWTKGMGGSPGGIFRDPKFGPEMKTKLMHYYSLDIPDINNMSLKDQNPGDLMSDFWNMEHVWQKANKSLVEPEEEDEVFIEFPDKWAWWLLPREYCSAEGEAMGHCGNQGDPQPGDRILSLREPKKNDKWEPHLTFIWRKNGWLGEMKGKGNEKPAQKYHKYIVELLKNKEIGGIKGGGYLPEHNFAFADLTEPEQKEIEAANPDFVGDISKMTPEKLIKNKGLLQDIISEVDAGSGLFNVSRKHVIVNPEKNEIIFNKYNTIGEFISEYSDIGDLSDFMDNMNYDVTKDDIKYFIDSLPTATEEKLLKKFGYEDIEELKDNYTDNEELDQLLYQAVSDGYYSGTYNNISKTIVKAADDILPNTAELVYAGADKPGEPVKYPAYIDSPVSIRMPLTNFIELWHMVKDAYNIVEEFFHYIKSRHYALDYDYDESSALDCLNGEL